MLKRRYGPGHRDPWPYRQHGGRCYRKICRAYTLLNGTWDFAYFSRDIDVPETIEHWDTIPVPSCWQLQGYENPNYSNINYPYPCDPPYVPDDNPCGVYEREFELQHPENKTYYIAGYLTGRPAEGILEILTDCIPATEEDYGTEYLDYIISMKTVTDVEEAIAHINKYNTDNSKNQ